MMSRKNLKIDFQFAITPERCEFERQKLDLKKSSCCACAVNFTKVMKNSHYYNFFNKYLHEYNS